MDDLEILARMAARLAGRDPDEHLKMALAEVVPFDDLLWRYPDFLARAEAAYDALTAPCPVASTAFTGQERPAAGASRS